MSEIVIVGLISGLMGVLAAGVPAYFSYRNAPSRRVVDTAKIVDATGRVISTLRAEIDRLDSELVESRKELAQMRVVENKLRRRITKLERQVWELGGSPVQNGERNDR